MEKYSSCLVVVKEGELKTLQSLFAKSEEIQSVKEISPRLVSITFQRQLDRQGIERTLSPFEDKIERWQPNYRMRPLTG